MQKKLVKKKQPLNTFEKDASLGYVVNFLARQFSQTLQKRFNKLGVSTGQFPILLELWRQEGLTQKDLCNRIAYEQPTIAATLKRMERDGLLIVHSDTKDRRALRYHLTKKARDLENTMIAAAQSVNMQASQGMTAAEIRQFIMLAHRLMNNLDA